ncbi:MAG: AMP-binding protein [Bacteroidales bacterium]|jgi:phenylacetate-CoA ligase|nr:AMP-binding protein [Bacteroidales bacterium]
MNIPVIEYQPQGAIRRYQERRLVETMDYLARFSPYYQRLFRENRINTSKIKTFDDLQYIPYTEKHALQLHNNDFLCVPREKIIDYITTSGTLGDPVTFAMTDADLERLAYNEKISFECAGAKRGDVFQLMTTIDKRFMAGLAYFLGIRKLGAGIIRVGNGIPELQWDTIQRIHPNTIIVVPSFILRIIKYAEEHGIDYRASSVKKAVCIGENLREQDFSLNLLGKSIRDKWGIELYSTYASTEMSTTFTECEHGCGGHHHPELIICELIGAEGNPVAEGETGELTVTTLGVEGMPLLRFKTGDLARFHYAPCRCGRTTMRISPIVGRMNHMVKYKGTTLYPPAIFDVLDNTPYIDNYVMVVSNDETGNDHVLVKVGLREQPAFDVQKDVKDRFRAYIRVAPDVEIAPAEEIRKINTPDISRKPVKFIDNRLNNKSLK